MSFVVADRVKEITTTVGQGDLALEGALLGFRTFGSVCADKSLVAYEIHGVDVNGAPTAEWEVGFGQWLTGGTLKRSKIISSSNFNLVVNFSAGEKHISLTVNSAQARTARWSTISQSIAFYVRSNGDDYNSGLENTAAGAFLTLQKAIDVATQYVETNAAGTVNIYINGGTPYAGATAHCTSGNGQININGPAQLLASDGDALTVRGNGARWGLVDIEFRTTTSGHGLRVTNGAYAAVSSCDFSDCVSGHVLADNNGVADMSDARFLLGTPGDSLRAEAGGVITYVGDIYVGTSVTIGGAFVSSRRGLGLVDISGVTTVTNPGGMTGKRYSMVGNSVCYSNGKATTFLPGTIAGTTATGGQYL